MKKYKKIIKIKEKIIMANESKYVVVKQAQLPCEVTINKNKETGNEYVSFKLKCGKYSVVLQTRNYNEVEQDVIKEVVKSTR